MRPTPQNTKRILVLGDHGRGKTTFALALSKKLNLPMYSTDDIYWKIKFSVPEEPSIRKEKALRLYTNNEWIVEGSSESLVRYGYEPAEIIIHLKFQNVLSQWYSLGRRSFIRHRNKTENETVKGVLLLMRHAFYKRYKLGYKRNDPTYTEILASHKDKIIELKSYKEINDFLNTIKPLT